MEVKSLVSYCENPKGADGRSDLEASTKKERGTRVGYSTHRVERTEKK